MEFSNSGRPARMSLMTAKTSISGRQSAWLGVTMSNEANLEIDDLNQADSDLDDIEDFVEADTNQNGFTLNQSEPRRYRRKQIRICRHKLQT